jgi:hypothetical protein
MKTKVYTLFIDTENTSCDVLAFATIPELKAAIVKTVMDYQSELESACLAQDLQEAEFESEEWNDAWETFQENGLQGCDAIRYEEHEIDLAPAPAPAPAKPIIPGLEHIMQVPHLSTVHITAEDGKQLALNLSSDSLAVIERGFGHILHFESEDLDDDYSDEAGFSQSFRDMLHYLARDGFKYVRLDPDGDILPGLPVFTW